MTLLPWLLSLAALAGVVLNIRKRAECFALWTVTNSAWAVIDLQHDLPAQAALQAVYAVLSVWGLVAWGRKRGEDGAAQVKRSQENLRAAQNLERK
jgi:nicotinamide riboside transporter PnuC